MDATDEHLMARVQAGDRQAFQVLMNRHVASLHRFAQRLLRNSTEAEDVTQEALLRLWQHAARWEPGRVRFTTWLFRIAHNLCVDRYRRNGSAKVDESIDVDTLIDEHSADGAASVGRNERQHHVRRALNALPERQRTALVLCFYQAFSNQEAAAILDVSVDALESLLSRARRALRADLVEYSQGDSL